MKQTLGKLSMLFAFSAALLQLSSCQSEESAPLVHNPSEPVKLTTFYPDSGMYKEQVILEGTNFGQDVSKIKVYFNNSIAPVIGSTGSMLYVTAPRLPGDTCRLSVVVDGDSVVFDKPFIYHESISVTTIAGTGQCEKPTAGDINTATMHPRFLCVDGDDNIFLVSRGHNGGSETERIMRIDQQDGQVEIVVPENGNVPCADPVTNVITIPTETTVGSYVSLDPAEMWSPRQRELIWPAGYAVPESGFKHCMVVNPNDGCIYTRYYYGDIIKINPRTYEVTPVYKTAPGNSYGLTFSPLHPNILYISFFNDAGTMANSIASIDVTRPDSTYQRLSSSNTSGGHRDGMLEKAQFHNPCQIYCDAQGYMYVADKDNHCIRRISPEGMVETVLGVPGTAGYKDGSKKEALFREPTGIGIGKDGSVYVADWGNYRVRKLTIN